MTAAYRQTPTQPQSPTIQLELMRSSIEQLGVRVGAMDESMHKLLDLLAQSVAATQSHVDALQRDVRAMRTEVRDLIRELRLARGVAMSDGENNGR